MKPTPFHTVTALTWGGSEVPPGESKASHEMFGWTGYFVTCLREMERTTGPSPWQREEIRPPAPPSPRARRACEVKLNRPRIRGDSDLGNEDGVMASQDKPTTRRYTTGYNARAVRMVRQVREERICTPQCCLQRPLIGRGCSFEGRDSQTLGGDFRPWAGGRDRRSVEGGGSA